MGDRANMAIQADRADRSSRVYFYLHWSGSQLPELARVALGSTTARARWTDASYLTRIIADALSAKAGGVGHETGMGISTSVQDDNHGMILVLDVETQEAYYETIEESLPPKPPRQIGERIPFATFAKTAQEWPADAEET